MSKIKGHPLDFLNPFKASSKVLGFLSLTKTVVLIGAVISISAVVFVPKWQVSNAKLTDKERIELENAGRTTLVQVLGGLFFFSTAYFSWRNLKVAEQNLKVTEQNVSQNIKATEEKQITERFAKAVELLGSENVHVRLGAIYALERIAEDSEKSYWQIIEILTAYVREESPYLLNKQTHMSAVDIPSISIDVQAILTVIARRKNFYGAGEEHPVYLVRSNLQEVRIKNANFQNANFKEVNLQEARLININFDKVILCNANLQNANFKDSSLQDANLSGANLSGANLSGVNLSGVNLSGANLSSANLSGANLSSANLCDTCLSHANLSNAKLIGANLENAEIHNTNFQSADLSSANLSQAETWNEEEMDCNFEFTYEYDEQFGEYSQQIFHSSDFNGTIFTDANLSFTNFKGAKNLTEEQVKVAENWGKARYKLEFCKRLGLAENN